MTKWLTVIGMGDDGYDGLSASARLAMSKAVHIVGSRRLLAHVPSHTATLYEWPQPFSAVIAQISPLRGEPTVILATGDPMNFGVTRKLLEFVPFEEITVIPHLSAFSLAAARLGWSLPDCDCFTIHGRPAANLEGYVQPDARLLVLTQDATSIAECARRLVARGFEKSVVTVLENLGGTAEAATQFCADAVPSRPWSELNTLAIHCAASPHARLMSRVPGLPDELFEHDGKITKREVRAASLAALAPAPDQLLWDIGAGSGAIAIEWMRSTRGCTAIAVESDPERCAVMARNADAFGTPRLQIVLGEAPLAVQNLAAPDAVFIGGGVNTAGLFEAAYAALKPGGMCVANTVTLEGDQRLITLQDLHGGDLIRMDISTMTKVGAMRALRPRMSVLQWRLRKGFA
jgi:precorrin-6B C5,15-methyltransferase / cobalt-precorrin-6B C5,C15-methyltransferase